MLKDRMGNDLGVNQITLKVVNRFYNYLADFGLFWLHLLCYFPSHHTRRLLLRLAGARIGKGSTIHMGCHVFSAKNIEVGADTIIGNNSFMDGRAPLMIGNHTDIASEVMIYNSEHDITAEDFAAHEDIVEIGDYVFIGPRVIILPGVKVGRGAVVAAGAIVTKSVPDFTIVGGVPAKIIGERALKDPRYRLGRARWFQ